MDAIAGKPPDPPDDLEVGCFITVESERNMMQTANDISKRKRAAEESFAISDNSTPKKVTTRPDEGVPSIETIYLHPNFNIKKMYNPEVDKGPFVVHVVRHESEASKGSTLRPIRLGHFLQRQKIQNITRDGIKAVGRNRLSVQFGSANDANKFLVHPALESFKMEATIPAYNLTRMGIVRQIPTEWAMTELVELMDLPLGCGTILKARRLNRKIIEEGQPKWIPTQSVVLTFEGQKLPELVYCCHTAIRVELYQYPTIICMKCCRFGHVQTQCRSGPRCYRCGQEHPGSACTVSEQEAVCNLCDGHHFATNKNCPEHIRQKSIKLTMAEENISYMEASRRHPKAKKSYADVAGPSLPPHRSSIIPGQIKPSSQLPHRQNQSQRKTVFMNPRPKMLKSHQGYDQISLKEITSQPPPSQANGCAYVGNSKDDSLLELILTMLINIVSSHKDTHLPNNVASKINILTELINNGPNETEDPSVEYERY